MRGGLATLLGLIGGVLIIVGVLIGGLIAGLGDLIAGNGRGFAGLIYAGVIDLVLGLLILVFTSYSRSHPPPDKAGGGVVLIVLAAIVWFFAGGSLYFIFVVLGAVLALLAGILFLLESAFRTPAR